MRLDEIRKRLEAKQPKPWNRSDCIAHDDTSYLLARVGKLEGLLTRLVARSKDWRTEGDIGCLKFDVEQLVAEAHTLLAEPDSGESV